MIRSLRFRTFVMLVSVSAASTLLTLFSFMTFYLNQKASDSMLALNESLPRAVQSIANASQPDTHSAFLEAVKQISGDPNAFLLNQDLSIRYRSVENLDPLSSDVLSNLKKLTDQNVGQGSFSSRSEKRGISWYHFNRSEKLGAILMVETAPLSRKKAFLDLIPTFWPVVLFIFFLALLISTLFSRGISKPIEDLIEAAAKLGEGHFFVQMKERGSFEVKKLSRAFNRLAIALSKRDKEIQSLHGELVIRERLATLGKVSAIVSHEIKNPLSSLYGYIQLLERSGISSEDSKKMLELSKQEIKRMRDLLGDVLQFSRQREPKLAETNIQKFSKDLFEMLQTDSKARQYVFECNLETMDATILVDSQQWIQVIQNLVSNSLDAYPAGPDRRVRLTVAKSKDSTDRVSFTYRDFGPGLSPEAKSHIFEPFFTTKEARSGTGLGMSLCFSIIHQHGGSIRLLEPTDGTTGAVFEIQLPVHIPSGS